MRKAFLSLALVLALCLSLAVPAFAAPPAPYEDGQVHITNVVESSGEPSEWSDAQWNVTLSCTAPAVVSVSEESANDPDPDYSYSITVERFTSDDTQLHSTAVEQIASYVQSVTLTEPGTYKVLFIESTSPTEEHGGGFTDLPYLVTIQEGAEPADPPATTDPSTTTPLFADVKNDDWFHDSVAWAVEKEITNGTSATTFSPNQNCTVAHILTFLWRASGSPKPAGDNPFDDVKPGDWFADAAVWASEKGMVSGDTFNPNAPCTRSMAVTYMWKAAGSPEAKAASFTDVPASADYAQAVNWAVEKGVTQGTSATTFSPDTVCTRGHIVTFLYRGFAE